MDAVLPQEVLQEVFDQVVREVTEQEAGIQLCLKDASPKGELYTVYAAFETGSLPDESYNSLPGCKYGSALPAHSGYPDYRHTGTALLYYKV